MTTPFEILPAEFSYNPAMKPYYTLADGFGLYVDAEFDLDTLWREEGGVGRQYLPLNDLSLHPLKALQLMGCRNTGALERATRYACGFARQDPHYCFVPVGLITSLCGLAPYREVYDQHGHDFYGDVLHVLPALDRFAPRPPEQVFVGVMNEEYRLHRLEQLYLGSGFTRPMLAGRTHCSTVRAVSLRLSNGDQLVGFAFNVTATAQDAQHDAA